jgi:hypothetical protein
MASFSDRIVGALKLDPKTYEEVEADQSAMGQAMTVVILAALASGIAAITSGFSVVIVSIIAALIGWFIWAGLTYLIGTKIMAEPQTHADFGQLLRTIGFSAAPGLFKIVGIIPIIGWIVAFLAGIWQLVAMVVAVRQALDYTSTGRAVVVCLIGWVVYMVVAVTVGLLVGGAAAMGGAMSGY